MEKTIDGVVYVLSEPVTPVGLCAGCAGERTPGMCMALGSECCWERNRTKVWIEKEKSNEG